jgi:hypothetical protein
VRRENSMIFSDDRTTKDAPLNTLREEQTAAWARFYAIEVDSRPENLSTIGPSPPPRDWTLRSPILSRRVEDGLRATGPFEVRQSPAASLLDDRLWRSVAPARGRHSRRAEAVAHRQHHNYGNCNIIIDRCNPPVSLVAVDGPPTHRRR